MELRGGELGWGKLEGGERGQRRGGAGNMGSKSCQFEDCWQIILEVPGGK